MPIELFCGKILDGRRRYAACRLAGIQPKTKIVSPAAPVSHAVSLNLLRRQLSPSQRSMVGDKVRDFYDRQAKERMAAGHNQHTSPMEKLPQGSAGTARDQAGKAVGVSGKLIDCARTVRGWFSGRSNSASNGANLGVSEWR